MTIVTRNEITKLIILATGAKSCVNGLPIGNLTESIAKIVDKEIIDAIQESDVFFKKIGVHLTTASTSTT